LETFQDVTEQRRPPDDDGDPDRTDAEPTDAAHSAADSQAERNREDESPS
jgi:hypothetical protein